MFDVQPPAPVTLAPETVTTMRASVTVPRIIDLFRVPQRYLRSVHLERDFDDTTSLRHYVLTPAMAQVLSRIVEGLRPGSGRRSWRITGDYGTGKSSLALILAHLLRDPTTAELERVRRSVEQEHGCDVLNSIHMVPVLVTGAREPLVPAVARAVGRAVERLHGKRRANQALQDFRNRVTSVVTTGDASQLLELLDHLADYAGQGRSSGVLLVLDELGKFLEYAALHPDREDMYVLQRLAEAAPRSTDYPFVVLGLLHQGFHAYAERLPSATRQEWDKVAGRYEEIAFDQPLAHVAALVAGSLNIDRARIPEDVVAAAEGVRASTIETGWYGSLHSTLQPLALYPLHPTVLPVLVRFFAQFGQHERSLFSFLLSSEPFGLQSFAERPANRDTWYRLSDFYDYIRSVFGHRLAGASYRSHWLRITGTLDRVTDLAALELRVLKAIAVLNTVDAEHLLPNDAVLAAAIADVDTEGVVEKAVASLRHRGLIFQRGVAGGYCLWPSTSVNVESAFEAAQRVLGPVDQVSSQIKPYLDTSSVLARRHYIETGTMRHFEVRYAESAVLLETVARPTEADGLVVVVLCESPDEHRTAISYVAAPEVACRPEVVLAVPPPLQGLAAEVQDTRCWQWVADNTPELAHDSYAAAEVARQVAASRRMLLQKLASLFGLKTEANTHGVEWWRGGKLLPLPQRGRLSAGLSVLCDELYEQAPVIRNELLNRRALSSAAAAARLRLIERMFSASDQPDLGIDPHRAPPEKSMYLSVLGAGNVHREEAGRFMLAEPPEGDDPLRLRPALTQIVVLLEQGDGHRIPVPKIFDVLQNRPYGVRAGVAPLLLAIMVVAHAHEVAVYEHGTFLQQFNAADFLRLIKQPSAFELQLCRVVGVRAEVFTLLVQIFAGEHPESRNPELLDVVRPLSRFAAQLPEYTRRSPSLPDPAKSVRDALLTAREPATLIFETLPSACGLEPFDLDGFTDIERARHFVAVLRDAMANLRATYPRLLERIRSKVSQGLGPGGVCPERAQVTQRASKVMLAAREPRLQTFARCLADKALSDDAWAERVGSFVISKPPARWTAADETRALDEIDVLSATFCRVEATAFPGNGHEPDISAVRVGLTNGDGSEAARVVRIRNEDEAAVQELALRVEQVLAEANSLKLAAISKVLWNILVGDAQPEQQLAATESPPPGSFTGDVL